MEKSLFKMLFYNYQKFFNTSSQTLNKNIGAAMLYFAVLL